MQHLIMLTIANFSDSRSTWLSSRGEFKFEVPTRPMKIDGHPFPTNMADTRGKGNTLQTKLLTSQSTKGSGVVDPRVQVLAGQWQKG